MLEIEEAHTAWLAAHATAVAKIGKAKQALDRALLFSGMGVRLAEEHLTAEIHLAKVSIRVAGKAADALRNAEGGS